MLRQFWLTERQFFSCIVLRLTYFGGLILELSRSFSIVLMTAASNLDQTNPHLQSEADVAFYFVYSAIKS